LFYLSSIYSVYFKAEMSLSPVCSAVNYMPWLPWLHHPTSYFKSTMPCMTQQCLPVLTNYWARLKWCRNYIYLELRNFVCMITSATDGMWCNHGNPTMVNNPNPLLSKAECYRQCIHLESLNFNYFKMVEATGWTIIASRSFQCLPNFMKIYQLVQKLLRKHRQTDDLISLFYFWKVG
jgi:hypothetical protein